MPVLSERIFLNDQTCPVIRFDKARRNDKTIGFSMSLALHVLIFILVGVSLVKPPEFGVERGLGSIDVALMAAEAESSVSVSVEPVVEQKNDIIQKEESKFWERKTERILEFKGKDQTTIQSTGGAITEARPDYLRNPAPIYPDAARRQSQEGTVILLAFIDKEGHPVTVKIDKSSGHFLLDQAAMKAVEKWRFRSAMLGGIAVKSSVRVPVKFKLI